VSSVGGGNKTVTINGIKVPFVFIKAGSIKGEDETITVGNNYYMAQTEVTQAMWKIVMGSNPSNFKGDNLPVECVSWNDCQEFIKKWNDSGSAPEGYKFALPTEMQWEYACRAGSGAAYGFGDDKQLGDYAWYGANSGDKTHEVGTKKANAWGLYDMHGNVWEWTDSASSGVSRVLRGGSWDYGAVACRSAYRYDLTPVDSNRYLGLRVALVPSK
jgi:formylglycine-generating enzyme required for sulfatase activity